MLTTFVYVLIVGLVIGLLLWLITAFVPMNAKFKQVLVAVVTVVFVVAVLLMFVGGAGHGTGFPGGWR